MTMRCQRMTDRTAVVTDVPELLAADPADVGFDADRLRRLGRHFAGYVDDGRLPGFSLAVARGGRVAYAVRYGHRDREAGLPVEADTLFRIYSMTKPVTSVAALMLWEEGRFELTDPVAAYLPEFAEPRVLAGGSSLKPVTVPATEPIRIRHLLTHTAGLTYGFHRVDPVDAIYRDGGYEFGSPAGVDLAGACRAWARFPLVAEPGTTWNYSVATDVVGRLVEVVSGQSLDEFFAERILGPLGMADTTFGTPPERLDRLATLYSPAAGGGVARNDRLGPYAAEYLPPALSGGAGLVSTLGDYHRFAQLLARGGELPGGGRLLGPRTVRLMASNHLPGGADLTTLGRPVFAETKYAGMGFGLGVSVVLDPVATGTHSSVGEFGWGGFASTVFLVAPAEDLTAVFLTQLVPSDAHPIRPQLRQLLYSAIVD
jgi:CubicO group peptidase (beta-lactamase class C family)